MRDKIVASKMPPALVETLNELCLKFGRTPSELLRAGVLLIESSEHEDVAAALVAAARVRDLKEQG